MFSLKNVEDVFYRRKAYTDLERIEGEVIYFWVSLKVVCLFL